MFKLNISIQKIQHIEELLFEIDLSNNGIYALVGKNGTGKTLLFKAISNLCTSTTFHNTSNKYIFNKDSTVEYTIDDGKKYLFSFNDKLETLDFKGNIDKEITNQISVELPIPFGERFKHFQRLGNVDDDIRTAIVSRQVKTPDELVEILRYVYDSNRFDKLVEIQIRQDKYYAIELENHYYIREDYFSSGEYFIVNIYKLIQKGLKLIAVDEIDISLDAMAQVRLIKKLRELSHQYAFTLLFSTHSLALMKTLATDELKYMEIDDNRICSIEPKSYAYIKSEMYGFEGYDKYILVEDEVEKDFLQHLIHGKEIKTKFLLLPIGTANSVVQLMTHNKTKKFFGESQVVTVLDGDQSGVNRFSSNSDVLFLPFESVEKEFYGYYKSGDFGSFSVAQLQQYKLQGKEDDKKIYKMFLRNKLKSQEEIFDLIIAKNHVAVENLTQRLLDFLNGNAI